MSQQILKGCSPLERILCPQLIAFVGQTHEVELLLQEEISQACLQIFDSVKDEKRYVRQIQLYFTFKSPIVNCI